MIDADQLSCRIESRRKRLFDNPRWNGIDFIEVLPGQAALCVHFFGRVPDHIGVANVRIEGGRRIRGIRVVQVAIERAHDEELDDCLHVTLDKPGDFSTYRLCLVEPLSAAGRFISARPEDLATDPRARDIHGEGPAERRPRVRGAAGLYQSAVVLGPDFEVLADPVGDRPLATVGLRVNLVRHRDPHRARERNTAGSVDLGLLRTVRGEQSYAIPAHAHPDDFSSVVISAGSYALGEACFVPWPWMGPDEDALSVPPLIPLSGLDPRYSCVEFSFKVECPSDLDCKATPACPPQTRPAPDINYLARDYASFRQLILDRLSLVMPDWHERHVPDLGITLVELLAYAGDHLSYYQDAVATEAYLDTARKRISVRRHARLVDYRMHEGNNARAFVTVQTDTDLPPLPAKDFYFITAAPELKAFAGRVVRDEDVDKAAETFETFEPLTGRRERVFRFRAAHSEIRFHSWGNRECCLPKGATRATLLDEPLPGKSAEGRTLAKPSCSEDEGQPDGTPQRPPRVLDLRKGDVLIFEEVIGPTTGNEPDADPGRRHAVRLSKDPVLGEDGLLNKNVVEIEWDREDALPFSFCLSTRLPAPDCCWIDDVSVVRGNVVPVDHGRSTSRWFGPVGTKTTVQECACEGSVLETTTVPERFTAVLPEAPLIFAEDYDPQASASRLMAQDPRQAKPQVKLETVAGDPPITASWEARYDLLESEGSARHFVAEIDDEGHAHLRFGDGELGVQPAAGTRFRAIYRIGTGPAGNVGRDTINHMVLRGDGLSGAAVEPRNPLPARGGTAPEPIALVKLLAPTTFRGRRERAITAEDYAALAEQNTAIQRAAAELRWTGSWYEARVLLDPAHGAEADGRLLHETSRSLWRYRRMGHDLAAAPAQYVPLEIAIEICVRPHYARGEVKARLLEVLGNRALADGTLGLFHPDRLTFGQAIYLSQIVAAVTSVEGVETARVSRLQRLGSVDTGALDSGVLRLGPFEVAQCDSDPNFPERGRLALKVRGGR